MGNRVIKFEGEDRWAVWQSTSESMWSPTFLAEMDAAIFAEWYWRRGYGGLERYEDSFQMNLAGEIRMFLDEAFGTDKHGDRNEALPAAWKDEFLDGDEEEPYWWISDAEDLLDAFYGGKHGATDFLMGQFKAWHDAHHKPIEAQKAGAK